MKKIALNFGLLFALLLALNPIANASTPYMPIDGDPRRVMEGRSVVIVLATVTSVETASTTPNHFINKIDVKRYWQLENGEIPKEAVSTGDYVVLDTGGQRHLEASEFEVGNTYIFILFKHADSYKTVDFAPLIKVDEKGIIPASVNHYLNLMEAHDVQ